MHVHNRRCHMHVHNRRCHKHVHNRRHLKETVPQSYVTWLEMGKQNVQAEEVHCPTDVGHLVIKVVPYTSWNNPVPS